MNGYLPPIAMMLWGVAAIVVGIRQLALTDGEGLAAFFGGVIEFFGLSLFVGGAVWLIIHLTPFPYTTTLTVLPHSFRVGV